MQAYLVSGDMRHIVFRAPNGSLHVYDRSSERDDLVWATTIRYFMPDVAFDEASRTVAVLADSYSAPSVVELRVFRRTDTAGAWNDRKIRLPLGFGEHRGLLMASDGSCLLVAAFSKIIAVDLLTLEIKDGLTSGQWTNDYGAFIGYRFVGDHDWGNRRTKDVAASASVVEQRHKFRNRLNVLYDGHVTAEIAGDLGPLPAVDVQFDTLALSRDGIWLLFSATLWDGSSIYVTDARTGKTGAVVAGQNPLWVETRSRRLEAWRVWTSTP
jgi:hypothetical protein